MRRPRLELVLQQGLEKHRETELKNFDLLIGPDQIVHESEQLLTLPQWQSTQCREHLQQRRQAQHGRELLRKRCAVLDRRERVRIERVREARQLTVAYRGVTT